jgi:hypothetical protein
MNVSHRTASDLQWLRFDENRAAERSHPLRAKSLFGHFWVNDGWTGSPSVTRAGGRRAGEAVVLSGRYARQRVPVS